MTNEATDDDEKRQEMQVGRKRKPEPQRLRAGKAFHRQVQAGWNAKAEGDVEIE